MVNPDGQAGQARTINEGYKTIGGVDREVRLARRSVQVLPLLFISVSSPDAKAAEPAMPDMEQIVEKLRPELQKALGVPAVKLTPRPRTTSPRRLAARLVRRIRRSLRAAPAEARCVGPPTFARSCVRALALLPCAPWLRHHWGFSWCHRGHLTPRPTGTGRGESDDEKKRGGNFLRGLIRVA